MASGSISPPILIYVFRPPLREITAQAVWPASLRSSREVGGELLAAAADGRMMACPVPSGFIAPSRRNSAGHALPVTSVSRPQGHRTEKKTVTCSENLAR